jgi:hypothetical protein
VRRYAWSRPLIAGAAALPLLTGALLILDRVAG